VLPDFVASETPSIYLLLWNFLPLGRNILNKLIFWLCATYDLDLLSPLTPLTPLPSFPESVPPLKIILGLKRKPSVTINPSTPVRRSKRPRRRSLALAFIDSPLTPEDADMQSSSPSPEYSPAGRQNLVSVFSNRTLLDIEISDNFPLFYRRFPASSYYQTGDGEYIFLFLSWIMDNQPNICCYKVVLYAL